MKSVFALARRSAYGMVKMFHGHVPSTSLIVHGLLSVYANWRNLPYICSVSLDDSAIAI